MKTNRMLLNTAKVLAKVEVGGKKGDAALAALDRGILQVALMVSGLDGTILPAEYEAFGEMAKRCRGLTAWNVKELYDAAIGSASRLAEMARAGVYSEADRLRAFERLSAEVLPRGFVCGSLADLRRAFALWIAMGASDGEFTAFERKAVKTLVRRFALMRAARARKFVSILEPDFFAKVEKLVREMGQASRRENAEAQLFALISTVESKEKGCVVGRPTSRIRLPIPGPIITSSKLF